MIPPPASVRRILVRANNWIGDVVMISPAVRALRERFTGAEIAILARPWVLDALAANPYFDRLIPYESPGRHAGLIGRMRLAAELRRQKFDLAVLFQKAFDAAFLAAAARIPARVGHDTDHRGLLLTDRVHVTPESFRRHHVDFFLEVAEACGCVVSTREPFFALAQEDRAWATEFLAGAAGSGASVRGAAVPGASVPGAAPASLLAIHPGGSKAPRAWHAARFAELAGALADERGLVPMVVGDTGDAAAGEEIARAVPGTIIAAGSTTVRRMAALIERSALFVGNDSGPMHIAGAVGTPAVGIFGPGTPEKTAPRTKPGRFEAVTLRFPCSPCKQDFFRECDPAPSGKPWCIEKIEAETVLAACRRVLQTSSPPSHTPHDASAPRP